MLPPLHTTATRRPAKRPGGHAGDQQRLVAGVHVPGPVFGGELFTVLPHLVEILPVRYHLRAERPDGLHLPRIGRTRYADEGVRTVKLGRVRDRLPVIAGGRGDQPGRAGRRVERGDEVDPPAHLERADRLVVLVLDPHLRAGRGIQRPVPVQRGAGQVRRDAPARLQHVDDRGLLDVRRGGPHPAIRPGPSGYRGAFGSGLAETAPELAARVSRRRVDLMRAGWDDRSDGLLTNSFSRPPGVAGDRELAQQHAATSRTAWHDARYDSSQ